MIKQVYNKITNQLTARLKADLDNVESGNLIDLHTKYLMYLHIKYTDLTIIEVEIGLVL